MLFVDDGEPEVLERDTVLDEGLRSDDEVRLARCQPRSSGSAFRLRHRADEKLRPHAQLEQVRTQAGEMLPREYLGGSHQRSLSSVAYGDVDRSGRDCRLTRTAVAL